MFGKLENYLEKTREKIIGPREIEFENGVKFVTKISDDVPELKFIKNNEDVLDLISLAPKDTKVVFDIANKWQAKVKLKEINVGEFKDVDYILSFLHEAGHLHNVGDSEIASDVMRKYAKESFEDKNNAYPKSRLIAMEEERKAVIKSERNAWAYALRQARKIERELEINIFEKIGKAEDIRKYVNKFLETYEQGYVDVLYDLYIYNKKQMEELFEELDKESS